MVYQIVARLNHSMRVWLHFAIFGSQLDEKNVELFRSDWYAIYNVDIVS